MTVKKLRQELDQRRGEQRQTKSLLKKANENLKKAENDLHNHEQAREVIRAAALKTQETLAFHISDISTLALQAVFPEPYDLTVNFVQRRNKTECDLKFQKNKNEMDPLDATGGGPVDVASFALRIASWAMERPRSRPTIILDEPMRFLSTDLQPKASEMVKEISEKLGLQFIIITHEQELTEQADKIFEVSLKKGVSQIK